MGSQNFIPEGGAPFLSLEWFRGVGYAILGNSPKFYMDRYRKFATNAQQTILVDVSFGELMHVANNVPHLNIVISKLAQMLTLMEVKHVDKNGNEIEDSDVLKLLRKPNPLQSLEGFMYDYAINHFVYNSEYIYKNYATNSRIISPLPKCLWCLPSGQMRVITTGKMYRQTELKEIIDHYELVYDPTPFNTDEVIMISECFSINGIVAKSKIETLQIPLSNIVAALKSQNIIITDRGQTGIISSDAAGTNENSIPFSSEERTRLERDQKNRYGVDGNQGHVSFSGAPVKWIPMTFDVKQLMLIEQTEDAFCQICAELGADRAIFPQSIMGSSGLTTGAEKNEGLKITVQNTIQPIADKLMNVLSDQFGLHEKGECLVAYYGHMPCMKDDELKEAQAELVETQTLSLLKKDGIISAEAYAEMADVEFTGTGATEHPPVSTFGGAANGKD